MKTCLAILLAAFGPTGPLAASGPQLLVREARGKPAPLHIDEIAINVTVAGDVAETTILVGFKNDTHRRLEGDFVMPLPEGATVSSYALDVNGRMRPGVAVEKERARFAYESIKARRVDPGYVERHAGNVYRTKIFPIMPNTVKRVQLGYVETLKLVDGKLHYALPCQFDVPIKKFSCKIRGTGGTKVTLHDHLGLAFTEDPFGKLEAKAKDKTINGTLTLTARLPKLPALMVETVNFVEDRYFSLTDLAPDEAPLPPRPKPKSVLLIWDASESRQLHAAELDALDAWFQKIRNTSVRLQILRNIVGEAGTFTVKNGNWKELRTKLESVYHDGSTGLDRINLNDVPEDLLVICTDAVSPFGLPSSRTVKPVFLLNGSGKPTPSRWAHLAEQTGGAAIDLASVTPAKAAEILTTHRLRILSITGGGTYDCHSATEIIPGQPVRISGRLGEKADGVFTVRYGYGGTTVAKRSFTIESGHESDGGIVPRLWAQALLRELEAAPVPNQPRIIAHCRNQGLVSDHTSLIVLELFEDHVRYEIPPPEAELRKRYDIAMRKKKSWDTDANRRLRRLDGSWTAKRDWHRHDFPWMEVALLPRFQQVSIWTKAVSTVFRDEHLDQEAFAKIKTWQQEAAEVIKRRDALSNARELNQWKTDIARLIRIGTGLRNTPLNPPRDGKPLVVSVRGLVKQPGNVAGQPGLTLQQAIAKAGGVFTLGSKSNVELYRNAGKTVYNLASKEYKDIPLMPGDMIVVAEEYEPDHGWGDIDPFAPDTGRDDHDPANEPAVVEDSDVWVRTRSSDSEDPFAPPGSGPATPSFRSNISGDAPPPVTLTGTFRVQEDAATTTPAVARFEKALKAKDDPVAAYRAIRKPGPQPPEFYITTAKLLFVHGHDTLATQVLSNLLETPDPDLGRVLTNVLWLTEFDRDTDALRLLKHGARLLPGEVLIDYNRAMIDARRGETGSLARDLSKVAEYGERDQGVIALTDYNGLVARKKIQRPAMFPNHLSDNLDADIRIVVLGSDPDYPSGLSVAEPSGETCRYETSCGGRIDRANGISEYMMRRAMPGRYTISCRVTVPMTVRAIFYRNWGRPNQSSESVTVFLPGTAENTTIAEYDFSFEE